MIYLDVLLLVNFLIAWFLLLAAGAVCGIRASFGRMALGSGLAALSALILFAPELPYPLQAAYRIGTAAVIAAAAFGWKDGRRLAAVICWYAALNFALAGGVILVVQRTQTTLLHTGNLAVYLRIPPLLLLALAGLCCLGVELVLRFLAPAERPAPTVGLELELCGVTVRLRAALDTGCHLKDPMTCLPVLLISYPDARARLPRDLCVFLDAWFEGDRRAELPPGTSLRLIPCETAAQRTLLPGLAVTGIRLITGQGVMGLGRSAVAFAPRSLGNDSYEALYGSDFL